MSVLSDEGGKGGGANAGVAYTTSPSSIPPLNHHPPLPLVEAAHAVRQHATWLRASDFLKLSGDSELSKLDRKRKKRMPANHDVTDCLLKFFELSIAAVSANEKKNFFGDFSKKAENHFQKSGK